MTRRYHRKVKKWGNSGGINVPREHIGCDCVVTVKSGGDKNGSKADKM